MTRDAWKFDPYARTVAMNENAPREGCECEVCRWLAGRAATLFAIMRDRDLLPPEGTPVRPGTPAWGALMRLCGVRAR